MKTKYFLPFITLISCIWFSCKTEPGRKKKEVARDTTITTATAFNNLFLDSGQIEKFLQKNPEYISYRSQYLDFYKNRNFQYAWFDTSGIGEQASNFMNLLNTTIGKLHDSSLYNRHLVDLYSDYVEDSTKHKEGSPGQTELNLTGQFFAYASKVYKGSDIDVTELGWFIPRKKVDLITLLDSLVHSKGKEGDRYLPLNNQYRQLQNAVEKYYNIQKNYVWDSIPKPAKSYKQGDSLAAITQIKQRLFLLGDLPHQDSIGLFDQSLKEVVESFQNRMGLKATGIIDSKTMTELNYPITERIKQILINLERVRWMPAQTDSSFIFVNIPDFRLSVFDTGKYQFGMNVIVGKEGSSTVIFTGDLKYIVFSPYWNIPSSIVKNEIVPAMDRDPSYLKRYDMEITGHKSNLPVIRQKPGRNNSLGLVKFLFPNNFNIYLHDTPNKELFSRSNRTFSHGCIRIEQPKKMAMYLLRNYPFYTSERIDSLMHLNKDHWVTLDKPVPVFIGYFTAWVDKDGKLNFRKDIYGHDEKMADKLFEANRDVLSRVE